ncbi:MAG: hypothetical protein ACRYFV_20580 [Janthinobacterium lividum]
MFPIRIISFNNGWNILHQEKPQEWEDIKNVLLEMTPEVMTKPRSYMADEIDESIVDDTLAVLHLARVWDYFVGKKDWVPITYSLGRDNVENSFITNVKNKTYSKLVGGINKDYEIDKLLFITSPRAFNSGICDVFVGIVPDDSVSNLYGDLNKNIREHAFNNKMVLSLIDNNSNIVIKAPVVFVFFSQVEEELLVDERLIIYSDNIVARSIEFEPEYYQAGVGILSYFGEVLRQKYPDVNAKVRIEQDGNVVRMRIETPTGENEVIERELERYALVIANQLPPSALLENKIHVMQLENKLSMAELEIRQTKNALQLAGNLYGKQVRSLEEQIAFFRDLVSEQLRQQGKGADVLAQQLASHERIQLAQIGHAHGLFKDLIGEAHGNQVLLNAIRSLEHNLMTGITTIDVQEQVKESLATIKKQNPSLLSRMAAQLESAGYGLLAAPAFEWLKQQMQQYQ